MECRQRRPPEQKKNSISTHPAHQTKLTLYPSNEHSMARKPSLQTQSPSKESSALPKSIFRRLLCRSDDSDAVSNPTVSGPSWRAGSRRKDDRTTDTGLILSIQVFLGAGCSCPRTPERSPRRRSLTVSCC